MAAHEPAPTDRAEGAAPAGSGMLSGGPQQSLGRALLWMALALASFSSIAIAGRTVTSLMAAEAGREAATYGDTFQLMFYRSIVALVVMAIVISVSRQGWRQVRSQRLGLHAARNAVHFMGQFSWFHALTLIPLAQLFAIEFTAPIWVALLAPLLLSERMSWLRAAAICVGFTGVLIIVQPGVAPFSLGHALALSAAINFALSMIATRKLMATDTVVAFLFHMAWMQLPIAAVLAAPFLVLPNGETAVWLLILGAAALIAHFALAKAFAAAEAIVVAPMDFLRLPLIALIGALAYGEEVTIAVAVGGAVVLSANVLNLLAERQPHRHRSAGPQPKPPSGPETSIDKRRSTPAE